MTNITQIKIYMVLFIMSFYFQAKKLTSGTMVQFIRRAMVVAFSCIIMILMVIWTFSPSKSTYEDDYFYLIDIPFKFHHIPECNKGHNFIILVHTSPENINRRDVLRRTWASKNETDIDIFFLTGEPAKTDTQQALEQEMLVHSNFIHGDFLDSYNNLTYKHLMGLKYVFYHCPTIEYLVKIDDDVFVNIPVLKNFLEMYTKRFGQTRNILCSKRVNHPVLREGKWGVTTKEYPNATYPPHCLGYAIIYPKRAVELLYPIAQTTKYFWIDDVHITGTVASNAGVQQENFASVTMNSHELSTINSGNYDIDIRPVIFGPPETNADNLQILYDFVGKHGQKSSIMDYLT